MNAKQLIIMFVMLTFVSGVSAGNVVDMQMQSSEQPNQYDWIKNKLNEYPLVKHISNSYNSIAVNIDKEDFRLVLKFNQSGISEILESEENVDLELNISREDITYLLENYENMTVFDKLKFLVQHDIPVKDIMTFSGIAMAMR